MKNVVIYKDERFYSAFPDIEKLQNGDLVVVFREAPPREPYIHLDSEAHNVLVRSKDNGKTWGEGTFITYSSDNRYSWQEPVIVKAPPGFKVQSFTMTSYNFTTNSSMKEISLSSFEKDSKTGIPSNM